MTSHTHGSGAASRPTSSVTDLANRLGQQSLHDSNSFSSIVHPTTTNSSTVFHRAFSLGQRKPSSSTAASVHPSELRRLKEKELENKKRIDLRVQREDAATLSASEAEHRLITLRNKTRQVQHTQVTYSGTGLFRNLCSTDVHFLLDTTQSMQPYIDAAKQQIITIMDSLSTAFFHEANFRMAMVAYKDHGDQPHIQFLNFTRNPWTVRSFLDNLTAEGGGDAPEDVLGALNQALQASWEQSIRCIIHITDAPVHGTHLHDLGGQQDKFPDPGSEPHHLTHDAILNQLISRGISYALLRITDMTDRMAYTFLKAYAARSCEGKLDMSNKYHSSAVQLSTNVKAGFQSCNVLDKQTPGSPQFHEANLGSSYHHLRHLVVKMVTTSATRSCTLTVSDAGSSRQMSPLVRQGISPYMNSSGFSIKPPLDTSPPKWQTPGWLDQVCAFEAFSTNVAALRHGIQLYERYSTALRLGFSTTRSSVPTRRSMQQP